MIHLELTQNLSEIRAINLKTGLVLDSYRAILDFNCAKFWIKVPHNTDVAIAIKNPRDNEWRDLIQINTDYRPKEELGYTKKFMEDLSSYFPNPKEVKVVDHFKQFTLENKLSIPEAIIFQQNIGKMYFQNDLLNAMQAASAKNSKTLQGFFPSFDKCTDSVFLKLLTVQDFMNKFWTQSSFYALHCDSLKMLDSLNALYTSYILKYKECNNISVRADTAPCNCQKMANHVIEHGFGNEAWPDFPFQINFYHPTKNAQRWQDWDMERHDAPYNGSGEKYGLGGTLGGLQNYLVLWSRGNCSVKTEKSFEMGGSDTSSILTHSPLFEQIDLGYFCYKETRQLPEQCACDMDVFVKYRVDARLSPDAQQGSCTDWLTEGKHASTAEGRNIVTFSHYNVNTNTYDKIATSLIQDVASSSGGTFSLGGIPQALVEIAKGLVAIKGANPFSSIQDFATALGTVLQNPPSITGGNQTFGTGKYASMFDDTYHFTLKQNGIATLRLDNYLRMKVSGEDGFYNWIGYQSEFAFGYKWNAQQADPNNKEYYCCHDAVGCFIKSYDPHATTGVNDAYATSMNNFFFNVNYTPKFTTNSIEGQGFRLMSMNCNNWSHDYNYGGNNVIFTQRWATDSSKSTDWVLIHDHKIEWNMNKSANYHLKIYDLLGHEMFSTEDTPTKHQVVYDYSTLNTGQYIVLVYGENMAKSYKFITIKN